MVGVVVDFHIVVAIILVASGTKCTSEEHFADNEVIGWNIDIGHKIDGAVVSTDFHALRESLDVLGRHLAIVISDVDDGAIRHIIESWLERDVVA